VVKQVGSVQGTLIFVEKINLAVIRNRRNTHRAFR
jgi:hypothetical protein